MTDTTRPEVRTLAEALAEGLHKAMCFAPTTLHNRLACERPAVYLSLAQAALGHPAVREVMDVAQRSSDAAFGALSAVGDDLGRALAAEALPPSEGLREAARFMLDLVDKVYGTDHEPDPANVNDEGAWEAEADFRRHRSVILALSEPPSKP